MGRTYYCKDTELNFEVNSSGKIILQYLVDRIDLFSDEENNPIWEASKKQAQEMAEKIKKSQDKIIEIYNEIQDLFYGNLYDFQEFIGNFVYFLENCNGYLT